MTRFKITVTERDRGDAARAAALQCACDIPTCEYAPKTPRTDPALRRDPEARAKRPVAPLSE